MLPPRVTPLGASGPAFFGPPRAASDGGRRTRRLRTSASSESSETVSPSEASKPQWSAALEAAQAQAAQAAAQARRIAVEAGAAAAEHPLGSMGLELSSTYWGKLPEGARKVIPPAAGALAVLGVAAVARSRNTGNNPALSKALQVSRRVDDVAFLQRELLSTLQENRALLRRALDAELTLTEAAAAAGNKKKR